MRLRSLCATACLGLSVVLAQTANSKAAEIKLLCAIALQQLMENLGPKFEVATKHNLTTTIVPGPSFEAAPRWRSLRRPLSFHSVGSRDSRRTGKSSRAL